MKNKKVSELTCNFCKKEFVREGSFLNHICETKRRWQDRDMAGNRIGFTAWLEFFSNHNKSNKKKDYTDFIESAYYSAFVKFGNYCVAAQVLNPNRYVEYLLKNKISVDTWHRDSVYTKFIIEHLKTEDPLDAIARSIETCISLAENDKIPSKDTLRYGNRNKICFEITKGKISPWMLYHSVSGVEFIESLDVTQQKMIFEYINPEQWAIKFNKSKNILSEVKELLKAAGY